MGWSRLPILHTYQIEHHQTFTHSIISKTDFEGNISRTETSFSMRSWPEHGPLKKNLAEGVSRVDREIEKIY
jgi:hypothetical protein